MSTLAGWRVLSVRYWWTLRNRRARSYSLILAQIQPIFSRMIDVHAAFAPAVRPPPLRRGEGGRAERARVVRRRTAARALPLGLARLVGLSQTWLWWCWRSVRSAPVPLTDRLTGHSGAIDRRGLAQRGPAGVT